MKKVLISVAAVAFASAGFAQSVVFNNTPNGTYYNGSNLNLNEEGEWFQTNQTGAFTLSAFDLDVDTTGTGTENFSNLQLEVQVYGAGQSSFTGSGNEFSSLLSTQTISFGSQSLTGGYYYDAASLLNQTSISLNPVTTTDTSGRVGVVFTWLNAGAAATGLESAVGIGSTNLTVGSNAESDYNLTFGIVGGTGAIPTQSQYLYSGTIPTNMAVTLYATPAPEPVSMTFLGLGVAGLIARRKRAAK